MDHMHCDITEIADGIHRISTFVPEITPSGFTFNQFLIVDDEPLLYHLGHRAMFPMIAEAVSTVIPLESLRWLSFGHVEADECGAMNLWLRAAPDSQVTFGGLGCELSIDDMSDRPTRPLAEGEVVTIGAKRLRQISTPHVPHGWEAQVLFEETTGTLFCGDLLTQPAGGPPVETADIVEAAIATEAMFGSMSHHPRTTEILGGLAALEPSTLAVMHGSSFHGDGGKAISDLAASLVAPV